MAEHFVKPQHQEVLDLFDRLIPDGEPIKKDYQLATASGRHQDESHEELWEKYHQAVETALGENTEQQLMDFFTDPAGHVVEGHWGDRSFLINIIASVFSSLYCERHPSESSLRSVLGRLCIILDLAEKTTEQAVSLYGGYGELRDRSYFPNAPLCLKILSKHLDYDFIYAELKSIFSGKFNKTIDHGEDAYDRYEESNPAFLQYEHESFIRLLMKLYDTNEFDYDWFKRCSLLFPSYVQSHWVDMDEDSRRYYREREKFDFSDGFLETYKDYYHRLLQELIPELKAGSQTASAFNAFFDVELPGLVWLQAGLDLLTREERKAKTLKNKEDAIDYTICEMLNFHAYAEEESESDLLALLKNYDEKTLLLAYPYAGKARLPILKALGWNDIIPIHQALFTLGDVPADGVEEPDDFYNCESTSMGVIDRFHYLEMIGNPNPKLVTKYFKAIRASSMSAANILTVISALLDMDRDKIEKSLTRHTQIAIKAYGLFSVRDDNDLKERYLNFNQISKEASKYGQERCANTRAAVICGLKNLAQSAGYTDEVRMEWAMEADIASNMIPFDTRHNALDWQVSLNLEGITPKIRVYKQDKLLKSVPPKVRKTDIYQQMRDAQDQIKRQASAFRHTLEAMMCDGDAIEAGELETLAKLPVVSSMLGQLILKVGEGKFGLFSGNTQKVKGIDGKAIAIETTPIIAHVYDLFEAKVLSQWQQAIVEQQIVQPFKQAFRELYIVTPAEVEAGTHSRRFIGHVIDGSRTSRLLQTRQWSQYGGDVVEVFKRFPKHKMAGFLDIPDSRHYLAESDALTLDEIWFTQHGEKIALDKVPPLVFSEFMRDVDLIASVARVDDDSYLWSSETAQRRSELVLNLVKTIGLKQVSCEDHYAFIQGKLAKYRIHLGTGVIHIQPGNYLCIVPARDKHEDLYLPFADVDRKMAEIISKIFLLIADDKITDASILSQIKASLTEASSG